jgi:hypothetical protein
MKVPERLMERAAPLIKRAETFLREWEWTWTKAVVVSLGLWFIAIGSIAILPSWWLYFADQKLGWRPCPCPDTLHFWLFKLRDIVASGAFGTPFLVFIVAAFLLQKWRQRLRGESGVTRPTGGYR